ncbi:Uncharacterized ACR, COG1399 [Rhizobiales bacterium GAS191]|nr:Uncharacterized ACR, COG1399 [Rhizobiales bacterium GAS191]
MTRDHRLFIRPISVADLPARGRGVTVEASPEERARIAREFGLVAINALSGAYHVTPTARGARLKGKVAARIRQTCVVSLEPFDSELDEEVDLAFAAALEPGEGGVMQGDTLSISPDEEDPPEPLEGGMIDLGSVTLEFLALGLDPYPRKPGVELSVEFSPDGVEEEKSPSPFAVLAGLSRKPADKP